RGGGAPLRRGHGRGGGAARSRRGPSVMLYLLLFPLHTTYSALNVLRYITFRALMAALAAFVLSFVFGPWLIRKLTANQIGQHIRPDGPERHLSKAGTPTMGGVLILSSLVL